MVENKNIQPQMSLPIFQQIKLSAVENENINLSKTQGFVSGFILRN